MKRRTFLTALATLVSWFTIKPTVHADAINGSFTEPKRRELTFLRLWDGETLIDQLSTGAKYPRRLHAVVDSLDHRVVYIDGVDSDKPRATWQHAQKCTVVEERPNCFAHYHDYQYVSGPKWWAKRPHFLDDIDNDGAPLGGWR